MPYVHIPGLNRDILLEVYPWQMPIYQNSRAICYGGCASLSNGFGGYLPIVQKEERVVIVEKKKEEPKQEKVTTYIIKVDPISMVNLALILGIFLAIFYYFMKM